MRLLCSTCLTLAVLLAAMLSLCASPTHAVPPTMPQYYQMEWVLWHVDEDNIPPPYGLTPPANAHVQQGRGRTYYDWTQRSMIEIYDDFCVNIFPDPTDHPGPCKFLNVNETSYLINSDPVHFPGDPVCCVFAHNFHPPAPTFLIDNKDVIPNGMSYIGSAPVTWYEVPKGDGAPFNYGFYDEKAPLPAAFSFPAVTGWDWQRFYNFRATKPDPSVFHLDPRCLTADYCKIHL